jgi:hypothetical protein
LPKDRVKREAAIQREIAGTHKLTGAPRQYIFDALRQAMELVQEDQDIVRSLDEMVKMEIRAGPMPNLRGVIRSSVIARNSVSGGVTKQSQHEYSFDEIASSRKAGLAMTANVLYLEQSLLDPAFYEELLLTLIHEAGVPLGRSDEVNETFARAVIHGTPNERGTSRRSYVPNPQNVGVGARKDRDTAENVSFSYAEQWIRLVAFESSGDGVAVDQVHVFPRSAVKLPYPSLLRIFKHAFESWKFDDSFSQPLLSSDHSFLYLTGSVTPLVIGILLLMLIPATPGFMFLWLIYLFMFLCSHSIIIM